jgi:nitrogen regulatory protein P-II 1
MKLISGIVRPDKLEDVKQALCRAHIYSLRVAEVQDHTPQQHTAVAWMGHLMTPTFSIKMAVEVVVHDDDVDDIVAAILSSARTGVAGDGHVLVMPVEHRYNIRNGDRDVCDG